MNAYDLNRKAGSNRFLFLPPASESSQKCIEKTLFQQLIARDIFSGILFE